MKVKRHHTRVNDYYQITNDLYLTICKVFLLIKLYLFGLESCLKFDKNFQSKKSTKVRFGESREGNQTKFRRSTTSSPFVPNPQLLNDKAPFIKVKPNPGMMPAFIWGERRETWNDAGVYLGGQM